MQHGVTKLLAWPAFHSSQAKASMAPAVLLVCSLLISFFAQVLLLKTFAVNVVWCWWVSEARCPLVPSQLHSFHFTVSLLGSASSTPIRSYGALSRISAATGWYRILVPSTLTGWRGGWRVSGRIWCSGRAVVWNTPWSRLLLFVWTSLPAGLLACRLLMLKSHWRWYRAPN
jgi:hypothetical protein